MSQHYIPTVPFVYGKYLKNLSAILENFFFNKLTFIRIKKFFCLNSFFAAISIFQGKVYVLT